MDSPLHTGGHNTGLDHAHLDRLPNSTDRADAIDRPKMMLVPMRNSPSSGQTVAQRGAVERCFQVMRSQRIAAEQYMNKTGINQPGQGLTTTGMDDRRSSGKQYLGTRRILLSRFPHQHHPPGDICNDRMMRTFGRDERFHEAEHITLSRPF